MSKPAYDHTVVRCAGNLLSSVPPEAYRELTQDGAKELVRWAVAMAREIVAETIRTEPEPDPPPDCVGWTDGGQFCGRCGRCRARQLAEAKEDEKARFSDDTPF